MIVGQTSTFRVIDVGQAFIVVLHIDITNVNIYQFYKL